MSINCIHSQCRDRYECEIAQPLEHMIESFGLQYVLERIREICYEKASQAAVEHQDLPQAKLWLAKGIRVNSAAQGVRL